MTDKHCMVIAEAGVNHNGLPDLAFRLVDAAREAGADFVKFQTFRAETLVTPDAPKAAYQQATTGSGESQYAMLKRLELPQEMFRELADYCASTGIGFMSTPFDIASARYLAGLGMSAFKISSGDLTNLPFLRELGAMGLPIILSTGMATLGDVEDAMEVLETAGTSQDRVTLLHCTTEYPAPVAEVNLRAMLTMKCAFPDATIGYSDHTEGIEIPIAAAALGAQVLEKHFTLDKTMQGPDHKASLEPAELKSMVSAVRKIGVALGDGKKRPTRTELPNREVARKSIVAARAIRKGELLTADNLKVMRPGTGISPMQWDAIIGKPAQRDYNANEMI